MAYAYASLLHSGCHHPQRRPHKGMQRVWSQQALHMEHADEPTFMARWFRDNVGQIWFPAHIANSVEFTTASSPAHQTPHTEDKISHHPGYVTGSLWTPPPLFLMI